jgi:3-hydroxyacyl-[acyl-carrier-protein] dehydratase
MTEQAFDRQTCIGAVGIRQRIPHRYPFLMVDRIIEAGPSSATALKNVTINEAYFSGHFPAEPIMPGVLLGEALAQTAAFIGIALDGPDGPNASAPIGATAFLSTLSLKFNRPVVPGDQLILETTLIKRLGRTMKVHGRATVDGALVASGEFTLVLPSPNPT